MKIYKLLLSSFLVFSIVSCDRPECRNENSVFDEYGKETSTYKIELIKEVERIGMNNLRYWLHSYEERDGHEFILVNIQGEDLCAIGEIEVKNWERIGGIKEKKGIGYRGAELVGLTFDYEQRGDFIDLQFKDLDHILD